MSRIAYENSNGEVIDLNSGNFLCDEKTLRTFKWDYTFNPLPSDRGASVDSFYRGENTFELSLIAWSESYEHTAQLLNNLSNAIEYDVRMRTAGKLWLDNYYIECYIVGGSVNKYFRNKSACSKRYTVLPVGMYWCYETKTNFPIGSGVQTSQGIKKYNLRYPYKYGIGYSSQTIYNDSEKWETPSIITIYGPITNPSLLIAGNVYAVYTTIGSNERIVIDQKMKKIYKIGPTGTKSNLYPYRDKTHNIFEYIPSGNVDVVYSGDFGFDITLIHQRSEPIWT